MVNHIASRVSHGQSYSQHEHVACMVHEACSSQPMQAVNHQVGHRPMNDQSDLIDTRCKAAANGVMQRLLCLELIQQEALTCD